MTGQGTETGRNALAGLPAVQSRRLHRNRLYRRGERTFSSLGRRKSSTLQDSSTWNYTYNQRSEITSAIRKNASNVTQNTMRYGFDSIGNRTSSYENPTSKTYSANSLNQYTGINVVGSSSISPQYDDDGNMTGYGSWTYTWDAENRLVKAVNGTTRLEFIYDALSRRVAKKFYQGNTLSKHERYVYDGMKLLASYNAKSSYAKINTFLWQPFGLDVPLIMTYGSTIYEYLVDANKNVLGLFNPSKTRVATYLYGPSGQIISSSGTIAANNPIRFSSEQFDADLGLVYYNYRYYSPELGRWLSKDPIGEKGGLNLYLMCGNDIVSSRDVLGLNTTDYNQNKTKKIDYIRQLKYYAKKAIKESPSQDVVSCEKIVQYADCSLDLIRKTDKKWDEILGYIDFAVENLEKLEEGWNKNSKSSVRSEISKAKDLLMVLPLESISDRFAHKETVIASIQKALSPFEDVDSVFENTDLVIKLYKEFKQDPFLVSLSLAQKVSPKPLTPFMTFYHDAYEAVLSATTNIQLYSDLALDNFRRAIDDLSNLNNSCACSEAIGEFWGGHNDKCKRKLI